MGVSSQSVVRVQGQVILKYYARKYGAFIIWVMTALGLLCFAAYHRQHNILPGLVESTNVAISSFEDGTIESIMVGPYETVKKGQVVAIMDDSLIRKEQAVADAELIRLRAKLDAEQEEMKQDTDLQKRKELDEKRRFAINEEQARVEHLQMMAEQEANKMDLERLKMTLKIEEDLVSKGMTSREAYEDARLRYEALKKKISETDNAITAASSMHGKATERQASFQSPPVDIDFERILEPLRKEINVQNERIAAIQERRRKLLLVSLGDGQIRSVFFHKGENVMAGQPIVTLALATSANVVAYINEKSAYRIPVGTHVNMTSHYRPRVSADAQIIRVGSQIEPIPVRLQFNPTVPEYGIPVVLEISQDQNPAFYPGEYVHVSLN